MTENFRPLLAAAVETDEEALQLRYPLLASPKIDGIRVLIKEGTAITRSLKPVRNRLVQSLLGDYLYEGMDGEVVAGNVLDPMAFRKTTTAVMAEHSRLDFTFWIFDCHNSLSSTPFEQRFEELKERIGYHKAQHDKPFIQLLEHVWIHNFEQLCTYEAACLEQGFEGVMLRDPKGPYKYGRSTLREGTLLKLKRGQLRNGDAVIIGFKERMHNQNEATRNELGLQERSSHKEHMVGRQDLGSLLVRDPDSGHEFSIGVGVGLDDALRKEIWDNQTHYLGKTVRYEWFAYGGYDLPRFPKFVCIRAEEDLS